MLQDQSRNRTHMPAAQPPGGAAPSEPGPARAEAGIARMLTATAPATHPDAALLALGRQFDALHAAWMVTVEADREPTERFNAFLEATNPRGGPSLRDHEAAWGLPGVRVSHDREAAAFNALDPLFKAIKAVPAATAEGLAVKARAVVAANWPNGNYDEDRSLGSDEDWPHDVIRDLIESTFRLGGVDWRGHPRDVSQSAVQAQTAMPTASDPILTSIATTRAALNHALAVEVEHRRNGSKTDLPPAWHAASDAAQDAFHRFALKGTPNSQAGCQALAQLTLDLREGLGLDLEEESLIVLKRIAGGPSGPEGVTLKAVLEERRARADEFLALMRKDGFVPYPADKPQGLMAIDLAIPYEAERLLAIAQGEFDRRVEAYADFPPDERERHLSRMRAEYRLDELAAVVRGSAPPPAEAGDTTRAVLDAIQAHEAAWRGYSRANAAYDALGEAPGQTPASDGEIAAADEAATLSSKRADQAWRDLFRVRPQSLHDLWMLLTHIERHHRDHHGIEDAPDIWGTLTGAVAAIRTESKAPSAQPHDLSRLSVLHLSRLYEICRQQRDILLTIEGSPMCEERDGSGYNALGDLVEAEGERFAFLGDDVVHELERRRPSGTEERNYILETRVNHHLRCNGYIERELAAEIATAWGAK